MVQEIMKPLVYYDFKEIDDKEVSITKKRLEEIFEEVYQAGYTDGINNRSSIPYITTTPCTLRDDFNNSGRTIQKSGITIGCNDSNIN